MDKNKLDYAASGVDIDAAEQAVEKIKKLARVTFNESVLSEIGSFGGFFRPDFTGLNEPVFISSADGVGTKLKIAFMLDKHDTVGEDLVNHCVNDILVHGARPLFFLDYIGTGKVHPTVIENIVSGFSEGCRKTGMALLGGEIAEMPDFYSTGEYDLAGFIVGMVDRQKTITGADIKVGDVIMGLASNGLHTNGYSLARKICFEVAGLKATDTIDTLGMRIGEALLLTHKCYLKPVMKVIEKFNIKAMAHITGGGITGNLTRVLPDNKQALITKGKWDIPPIFDYLQKSGPVEQKEMYRAFNMGIGFIIVAEPDNSDGIINELKSCGETAYIIGEIVKGEKKVVLKD
jgi:phosphoribosylformylglycinamidine cyclo-ligase